MTTTQMDTSSLKPPTAVRPDLPRETFIFATAMIYTFCIYGPMAAMSIGAGLVAAAALFFEGPRAILRGFRQSTLAVPSVALFLACTWSLLWAASGQVRFFEMSPQIHWVQDMAKSWHLFFPFVLLALLRPLPRRRLDQLFFIWIALGIMSAVLAVTQHYVPLYKPLELPDTGLRGTYHATGLTGFHLSFASILFFPAACVWALALKTSGWRQSPRLAWTASSLLMVAALFLTYSKMAWAAIPIVLMALGLIGWQGLRRWILLTLIVVGAAALSQSDLVHQRFSGLRSINDRYILWQANWEMIRQFPFFGVGWHHNSELSHAFYAARGVPSYTDLWVNQGFESHAHNNILDQWATTGLLGLLAFLWWNGALLLTTVRLARHRTAVLTSTAALGFLGGWLALHINGLSQTNFWDAKVMHQLGWVTALTLEWARRWKEAPSGPEGKC